MDIKVVPIDKPEDMNFILGQAHFIKTAEVVVAETEQGRAILGAVDGVRTKGVEGPDGTPWREDFLRRIGYKF